MRVLLPTSVLALFGAALIHCSAEGQGVSPEGDDAGGRSDGSTSPDAGGTGRPEDGGADTGFGDAGNCSADNWCRTPLPLQHLELTSVWSFAANDAVAATTRKILHWDGTEWTATSSPDSRGPTSLWATSENELWGVIEGDFRILHGTRPGKGTPFTWSKTESEPWVTPSMDIIRGAGEKDLWVYGRLFGDGVIQHGVITTGEDGGTTVPSWTAIPVTLPELYNVEGFWVTEDRALWLAGKVEVDATTMGGLVRGVPSTKDPSVYEWSIAATRPIHVGQGMKALWGDGAGNLWAANDDGESIHAMVTGGGKFEWKVDPTNARGAMVGLWGSAPNDVWLVGRAGAVRHWDGTSWEISRLAVGGVPIWEDLTAVQGGPGGDVWIVGEDVIVHRAAGGGAP